MLCCNGLGDDAAASIADILRARAGSLTELNLASNGLTVAGKSWRRVEGRPQV